MNTIISSNLKRTSERIDTTGNVINPRTKQIIKPVETVYVPPVAPLPEALQDPTFNPLSIQQQIDEAEANLLKLKELKKLQIEEMKKQLAELEK